MVRSEPDKVLSARLVLSDWPILLYQLFNNTQENTDKYK